MKEILIIVGASGHGKVVADIAVKMNQWKEILFLDDDETVKECLGFKVVGRINKAVNYKDQADFFIAIGDNKTREKILEHFIEKFFSVAILIHPSVILGMDVEVGIGTVIMAGVIINSSTTIGKGCIVNTASSIDHDNMIGNYVHISPGCKLAGAVKVERSCWIGIGTIISNNITICKYCFLGAGTLVIKDIKVSGIYVGAPSTLIRE